MKFLELSVCLTQGHVWGESRRSSEWQTCRRCLMRRRDPRFASPGTAARAPPAGFTAVEPAATTRTVRPLATSSLRTLVVAARKGGAGKTTLAVHLALAAQLRGLKVTLADCDPQQSSTETLVARLGERPELLDASTKSLRPVHARAAATEVERLIIDTPGGPGPALSEAMSLADLVLLIARPTFLDIAAAVRTFAEARAIGAPSLIIINQAPPARGGQEHASVAKALEALRYTSMPVSAVIVHSRMALQASIASGRSVEELGPSPAADEIAALWTAVETRLTVAPWERGAARALPAVQDVSPADSLAEASAHV